MTNPLLEIQQYGQSVWYDNIRRSLITSGELQSLVDNDGLMGLTSNPAIFEKAIGGSTDYDEALQALARQPGMDAKMLYEHLAIEDIQMAADVMAPVYARTHKRDGYVSLEVSPYLAHDTTGTITEARRLWQTVDRPNVMIKVPGTPAGLPAIEQLISTGINVNVTLLFDMAVYEQVAEAYLAGLEAFVAGGGDPHGVASVASFFISRIDSAVDSLIEARLQTAQAADAQVLRSLLGRVAIANARLTYQRYQAIYDTARWQALAAHGAQTQRLLWASTSTKNPQYRDVLYVEELIGRDTVNTMPAVTLEAFRDHGRVRPSLEENPAEAQRVMEDLQRVGISLKAVAEQLLADAVKLFSDPFDQLLSAVEKKLSGPARP
jgi:transaldolase/glucose-6-phosphate isomerase